MDFSGGSDDLVTVSDNTNIDFGSGDFTVSTWFNTGAVSDPSGQERLIGKSNGGAGFVIYNDNLGDTNFLVSDGTNTVSLYAGGYQDNNWHQVTAVRNGTTFELYIDNVLVDSATQTMGSIDNNEALLIGQSTGSSGDYNGQLDEIRLYDAALDTTGVAALYHYRPETPTDLSSGIELNTDGGNDAYLYNSNVGNLLGGLKELTFEITFASNTPVTGETPLFSYGTSVDVDNILVSVNSSGDLIIRSGGDVFTVPSSSLPNLFDGQQHSIAYSWQSNNGLVTAYVDGQYIDSTTGFQPGGTVTGGAGDGTLVLGNEQDSVGGGFQTSDVFSGTFYDVRIWNDVRSESEIALNYNNKIDSTNIPTGLIANWQMDGFNGSNQVVDIVSANNLSIGYATGTGFTSSTPVNDLNIDENSSNGSSVGYVIPSSSSSVNDLVTDGSFNDSTNTATQYGVTGTFGGWTVTRSSVDLLSTTDWTSPLGGRVVDLDGASPGTIEQTLSTKPGTEYQVIFNLTADFTDGENFKNMRVTAGSYSQDFTASRASGWSFGDPNAFEQMSFTFTADSSATTLSFASLEEATSTLGPILADIQVIEVPQAVSDILASDASLSYNAATGKFYKFIDSSETFTSAQSTAATHQINSVGGQIVTIHSAYENSLVQQMASDNSADRIWIGASDNSIEGAWHWQQAGSDGDQFWSGTSGGSTVGGRYSNWEAGEPNDYGSGEDYAQMFVSTGLWNDNDNTHTFRYIIEWDASQVIADTTFTLTDDAGGRFAIDSSTGEITVADGSLLDYESNTSHDVVVQVTNTIGNTYSETITIQVNNLNDNTPINTVPGTQTVNEDTTLNITGISVNDADGNLATTQLSVNNGSLNVSLSGGATISSGSNDSSTLTLSGTQTQINAALATLSYQSNTNFNGSDTLTITSTDSDSTPLSDIDTVSITVNQINDGGSYGGDVNATTNEDTATSGTVTFTDTTDGYTGNTFAINAAASNGVASIDSAGNWTYTPSANFNGSDSFTVQVTDDDGNVETQVINITVTATNDSPVNTVPGAQTVNEDTWLSISGISVNDVDGNLASTQLSASNGRIYVNLSGGATISAGANSSSTLTLSGTQTQINAALATLMYRGDTNFNGSDSLTVTSTDSAGTPLSDTDTVNITVNAVNDAPMNNLSGQPQVIASSSVDGATDVHAADIDGDGDVDLVSTSWTDDRVTWFQNDGSGNLTEHTIATGVSGARHAYVADIDGDGHQDIIVSDYENDTVTWYENDGSATPSFTAHTITNTADGAWSSYAIDMDGDGDMDVLSVSIWDDKVAWYENDGSSTPNWTEHFIGYADGGRTVVAGDIDNDGDVDVATASYVDDSIAWFENDGAATPGFTKNTISTNALGAMSVEIADVDNDGDLDLVSASYADNKISWFENDGNADPTFTENIISTNATGARDVTTADMDGDGDLDIISASYSDNKFAWYENDGSSDPSFTEQLISQSANGPRAVAAADMDGDGDIDVVGASLNDDSIGYFENTDGTMGNQSTNEDTPLVFNTANNNLISISDIDHEGSDVQVRLEITNGTLSLSGISGLSFFNGDGVNDAILEFTGSVAAINAALDGMTYTPTTNFNGTASIRIITNDLGNTGSGGALTDDDTISIRVDAVNDAGSFGGDVSATTNEDTATSGTVTFSDSADGYTSNTFAMNTNASNGVASIDSAGNWTYTPSANFNGSDSFTVQVTDDDGNVETQIINITVNQQNDAGSFGGDVSATTNEDTATSGTVTFSDSADGYTSNTFAMNTNASNGVASIDSAGNWTYTPSANFNGSDSFTVQVTDDDGNVETQVINITVSAVNDAPILVTNSPVTVPEESTRTITSSHLNATDVDNTADQIIYTITSTPNGGNVRLNSFNLGIGGTFTQEDINNGLVTYRDSDDGDPASFNFTISDGTVTSTTHTFIINGIAINDAPVNTVPGAQIVNEDTALNITGISVYDEEGNLATTQLSVNNGFLNVNLAGGASISSGTNGSSTLTLSGTQTQINAALATLTYQGNTNFNGSDTLTVLSTDSGGTPLSDTDTVSITVNQVNDAGSFGGNTSATTNEDTATSGTVTFSDSADGYSSNTFAMNSNASNGIASIDSAGNWTYTPSANFNGSDSFTVQVTDDDGNVETQIITITVNQQNDAGSFGGDVSATTNEDTGTSGTVTFTDSADGYTGNTFAINSSASNGVASIDAAGNWTYTPSANFNGSDSFTVQVTDDDGNVETQIINITVSAVNDDPYNAGSLPASVTVVEDVASNINISSIDLVDPDSHTGALRLTLTTSTGGNLTALAGSGITISGNGTGTLTLVGLQSNLNTYLNSSSNISYLHGTTNTNGTGADTITLTLNDLGNVGSGGGTDQSLGSIAVNITSVNDVSSISNLDGDTLNYNEGDGAVVIEQGGDVVVSDVDSINFDTGTLTVSFVAGEDTSEDRLSVQNVGTGTGQIGVSGSNVTYEGVVIGSMSGGGTGVDLTITFNSNATSTAVSALINNITYENTDTLAPTTTTRSVSFVLTDGDGGASASQTTTINISTANDAALTFAIESSALNYTENDGAVAVSSTIRTTDFDDTHLESAVVQITGNYVNGEDILSFTNQNGISGSWNATNGTLTLTGTATLAEYEAALRSITYTNTSENPNTANRTVSFTVNDGDSNSNTLTRDIAITAVNDEQVIATNTGATVAEGSADNIITNSMLSTTDVESTSNQIVYTVNTLPTHGTLNRDNVLLTVGDTFTQADIDNNLLCYTHDGSETTTDSFAFSVDDGVGATSSAVFNWSITAVNDAPTAVVDILTTNDGSSLMITPAVDLLANDTDIEGDAFTLTSFTQPQHGSIVDNGNGTWTYTTASGYHGNDYFTYTVTDIHGASRAGTVLITTEGQWSITGDTDVNEGNNANYTISFSGDDGASVDLSLTNIDTNSADYSDFVTAINNAVASRPDLSFDGTTLTYTKPSSYSASYDSSTSNFVDISATGTSLSLADDSSTLQSLGFNFEFYGVEYDELYVSSNGVLTFTNPFNGYSNTDITTGNELNGLPGIMAFWDDLATHYAGSDSVYVQVVGTPGNQQFIVQYNDIQHYGNAADQTVTFQIVLSEGSNDIEFRYQDTTFNNANDNAASATIAITNGSDEFVKHSYNTASVSSGSNIHFTANNTAMADLSFSLSITNDAIVETDESYSVSLGSAVGSSVATSSQTVTTEIDGNDPMLGQPVITGTASENQTLTADTSSISDEDGLGSFSYQWYRDGIAITGATSSTYTLGDNDVNTNITVAVSYTDGEGHSESATSTAVGPISNINDVTLLSTIEGVSLAYTENAGAALLTSSINITDIDDTHLESAVVQITGNYVNGEDVLSFTNQNGISGSWNTTNGTLTLTGTATLAEYEAALRSITYTNTSENPSTATRTVSFTVNDGDSNSNTLTRDITITAVNDEQVIATNTSATVAEGSSGNVISNTMLATNDVDNTTAQLVYTVNTIPSNGTLYRNGVALNPSDTFTQADIDNNLITYTHNDSQTSSDSFSFTVDDAAGATSNGTFNFTITNVNDAPVNTVPGTQVVNEDTSLNITGISVNDVDGNLATTQLTVSNGTLNVNLAGGATISSGSNNSNTLTLSGTQSQINAALASLSYQCDLNFNGSDTLTVTSIDSDGIPLSDIDTVSITVNQVADAGSFGGNLTGTTNEDTATSGTATFTDSADGYTSNTFAINTSASNGVALIDTAGNWTYTPNANFNGSDSFTIQVTDDDGNVETQVINITVNQVNDAGGFGGNLTAATNEDIATSGTITFSDSVDGYSANNFVLNTNASNGVASIDSAGNWTYTPNANFYGSDSFTVQVTDDDGNVETQVINITVNQVNDAGVFGGNLTAVTDEDTATSGTVTFTDTIDGYSVNNFAINTNASNGTASIDSAGNWTYTPNLNFNGSDSFIIQVTDDDGNVETQVINITINPVNDVPIATDDSVTVNEGSNITINLVTNDVDPEGLLDLGSITIIGMPSNGILINNNDGTMEYYHDGSETISDSFTYTINDTAGLISNIATVNITVNPVNDAPQIISNQMFYTHLNGSTNSTFNLVASDPDNLDSSLLFSVSSVLGGQFEEVSNPGVAITSFTQQQVIDNEIQFMNVAGETPYYEMSVSDSLLSDGPDVLVVFQIIVDEQSNEVIIIQIEPQPIDNNLEQDISKIELVIENDKALIQVDLNKISSESSIENIFNSDAEESIMNSISFEQDVDSKGNKRLSDSLTSHLFKHLLFPEYETIKINELNGYADSEIETISQTLEQALSNFRKQINNESEASQEQMEFIMNIGQITGISLSVGSLSWLLRLEWLFSVLLSTVPSWRSLDPLAVLNSSQFDDGSNIGNIDQQDDELSEDAKEIIDSIRANTI